MKTRFSRLCSGLRTCGRTGARSPYHSARSNALAGSNRNARAQGHGYDPSGSPAGLQLEYDVVVVGAGAAGLTAAHYASKLDGSPRVAVLERTSEAGKKVLMSGGTRCNVLPSHVSLENDYFTESSLSALRAIFASWSLEECLNWLTEDVGLQLQLEAADNKYFPSSNSAKEVRDKLVGACVERGVTFRYKASVAQIISQGGIWNCVLQDDSRVFSKRVVFATGGKSFPLVSYLWNIALL